MVSLEQAQQVAEHLAYSNVSSSTASLKKVTSHFVLTAEQRPALYVFNYQDGGFSIVSADKHLLPVLAYSTTSTYTNTNKPGGLLLWERKMAQTVADARALATPVPDESIIEEWEASLSSTPIVRQPAISKSSRSTTSSTTPPTNIAPPTGPPQDSETIVGPLVPVTWGQGCTYNDLYTAGASACNHRWTGCVVTAMAQVMARWRYPTTYNWAAMPVNQGNAAVAQLMADCRDEIPSIDDSKDSGTSADTKEVAGGYPWYFSSSGLLSSRFHYSSSISYEGYNLGTLLNNLRANQPVILRGCSDSAESECHAWVCDGYQENCYVDPDTGTGSCYVRLHMNWGWHEVGVANGQGGDYNGWFSGANWNISGVNRNYQYANKMVVNIHP